MKLTRLTHQKMNEMKNFMGQQTPDHQSKPEPKKSNPKEGEYIDYEEVK